MEKTGIEKSYEIMDKWFLDNVMPSPGLATPPESKMVVLGTPKFPGNFDLYDILKYNRFSQTVWRPVSTLVTTRDIYNEIDTTVDIYNEIDKKLGEYIWFNNKLELFPNVAGFWQHVENTDGSGEPFIEVGGIIL